MSIERVRGKILSNQDNQPLWSDEQSPLRMLWHTVIGSGSLKCIARQELELDHSDLIFLLDLMSLQIGTKYSGLGKLCLSIGLFQLD